MIVIGDTTLELRDARKADENYIRSTFARSAWDLVRKVRREHWYQTSTPLLERLLAGAAVTVACAPEDNDALFGWAAATDGVLWYVYVPFEFRGLGLARELVRKVQGNATETG